MAMVSWDTLDATPEQVAFYRRRLEQACERAVKANYGVDVTVTLVPPKHILKSGTIFVDIGKDKTVWETPKHKEDVQHGKSETNPARDDRDGHAGDDPVPDR